MKYLLTTLILTVILAVSSIPLWASPQYEDYVIVQAEDPVAQDPSMFGDYDTSISSSNLMSKICRLMTPLVAEYIYAPSEDLFKASEGLQLWGCPNADRESFKRARGAYLAWKKRPSTLPVIYAEY